MRLSIRLNPDDSQLLARLQQQTGHSATDLLREALRHYAAADKPPASSPQPTAKLREAQPPKSVDAASAPRVAPFDQGVGVRVLNVPLDPVTGLYDDGPLQKFLAGKKMLRMEPAFNAHTDPPHWSVWVQYHPILTPTEQRRAPTDQPLSEADQQLLDQLKQWRKQRAEQDGVPVFVVATNRQLEDLVMERPQSLTALQQIKGFGNKKIQRYGQQLVGMLSQPDSDGT